MVIGKLIIKDLHRDQLISTKLELFEPRFITINNQTYPCACRAQRRENLKCKILTFDFGLNFNAKSVKTSSNVFDLRIL